MHQQKHEDNSKKRCKHKRMAKTQEQSEKHEEIHSENRGAGKTHEITNASRKTRHEMDKNICTHPENCVASKTNENINASKKHKSMGKAKTNTPRKQGS